MAKHESKIWLLKVYCTTYVNLHVNHKIRDFRITIMYSKVVCKCWPVVKFQVGIAYIYFMVCYVLRLTGSGGGTQNLNLLTLAEDVTKTTHVQHLYNLKCKRQHYVDHCH